MEFSSLRYADVVVASPVGRVDYSTAGGLEQALQPLLEASADAAPAIVLDFSGVHYISSAGLRVLMIAAKKMQARQAAIGVAALQPMVQAIFEATRWDQVVDVFPSVRAALHKMSATALAAWEGAAEEHDAMKRIRFWGTRGSLPVALTAREVRDKVAAAVRGAAGRSFASERELGDYLDGLGMPVWGTYGGHTSCIEIETGGPEYVLCDLGSGVRPFAQQAIARHGPATPQTYHIFMSHVHWDHIMGFPFFTPAYIPGNRIRIYGGHPDLEGALRRQHGAPSFPVDFTALGATIEFVQLQPGIDHEIAGLTVRLLLQRHAGDSFGFRFTSAGRSVVYTTDSEHKLVEAAETERFIDFFRDADIVIFDAMYSLAEAVSVKADWGHSSNIVGVELCHLANVRQLCLFHHEPALGDVEIARVLAETRRFEQITRTGAPLVVTTAYDGLEIDL